MEMLTEELQAPKVAPADRLSLAFETNGKGCLGHIIQLPGAFVRAPTEVEALSKVMSEMKSYNRWLGAKLPPSVRTMIVQWHQSQLRVEDADSEILLDVDRKPFLDGEFATLLDLVRYSGETIYEAYEEAELKEWVDESRRRNTFYGTVPSTIQEVLGHVNSAQHFYMARLGVPLENGTDDFLEVRRRCVDEFVRLHDSGINSNLYSSENELWTLKKVLRRLVWHDRIHGKAIIRILAKQKRMKLIDQYSDPFRYLKTSL
jgi:hypothetical protein